LTHNDEHIVHGTDVTEAAAAFNVCFSFISDPAPRHMSHQLDDISYLLAASDDC